MACDDAAETCTWGARTHAGFEKVREKTKGYESWLNRGCVVASRIPTIDRTSSVAAKCLYVSRTTGSQEPESGQETSVSSPHGEYAKHLGLPKAACKYVPRRNA